MPFHRVSTYRRLLSFAWPFIVAVLLLMLLSALSQSVLSSVRAYIVGESQYSKGQKWLAQIAGFRPADGLLFLRGQEK